MVPLRDQPWFPRGGVLHVTDLGPSRGPWQQWALEGPSGTSFALTPTRDDTDPRFWFEFAEATELLHGWGDIPRQVLYQVARVEVVKERPARWLRLHGVAGQSVLVRHQRLLIGQRERRFARSDIVEIARLPFGGLVIDNSEIVAFYADHGETTLREMLRADLAANDLDAAASRVEAAGDLLGQFHAKCLRRGADVPVMSLYQQQHDRLAGLVDLPAIDLPPCGGAMLTAHDALDLDGIHTSEFGWLELRDLFGDPIAPLTGGANLYPAVRDLASLLGSLERELLRHDLDSHDRTALAESLEDGWRAAVPTMLRANVDATCMLAWRYEHAMVEAFRAVAYEDDARFNELADWMASMTS